MHILLVRFSSMGDVVLQTATVNWLKSLYGSGIKISFATSMEFSSLVASHPCVDQVISFDRRGGEGFSGFLLKLRQLHQADRIDLILDMHATLRSLRLRCHFWNIPALTVDKRRVERFLMTKIKSVALQRIFKWKALGMEPQVVRILKDFASIFSDSSATRRTQDFRNGPHRELTSLCEPPVFVVEGKYLVLAPSASFFYKRWPVENFVSLARELLDSTSYQLVVLAGPDDKFCQAFDGIGNRRVLNLQGKTSLSQSMSLLSRAEICIGNDSGMNHIAEAYGVPCVTVFGPTDPRFGFAPHGQNSTYLSKALWCKPCSTTGKAACYRDRHYCMELIGVAEVKAAALSILAHS
ncbi:MAG TPA: glycosyltransferase family 9 protein [Bacteriovoracaceae bacterium]|nr:glycosyltransferase family 9 protein [Bacteriovoracaceae bacterium]